MYKYIVGIKKKYGVEKVNIVNVNTQYNEIDEKEKYNITCSIDRKIYLKSK